jgi:hypothetical protein
MAEKLPIRVYVIDSTYDQGDEDSYPDRSEAFRRGLEAEFQKEFGETNVGAGADVPAFVTEYLAPVGLALYVFFKGKDIQENLDAWAVMFAKLKRLFYRTSVLDRQAAAIVAVAAIVSEIGRRPKRLKLVGYRPEFLFDADDVEPTSGVADDPDALSLGGLKHVFEILADGSTYRVVVNGNRATSVTRI